MRITVISNNWANRRGFIAEHGLSLLIKWRKDRLLFDTGQGLVLPANLSLLKRSTREINAVALSHGHYDHGGALEWLGEELEQKSPPLYAHPDARLPRYRRSKGTLHRIDISTSRDPFRQWKKAKFTRDPVEVFPGLWLTGEIRNRYPQENPETEFLIDRGQGPEPDPFLDDQAVFAETANGLVIMTGCAHSGLIATIDRVLDLSDQKRIHAIIGGFHLGAASKDRIEWTVEQLKRWNVPMLAPMHCTGFNATSRLREVFGDAICSPGAGDILELNGER